ncbi:hypothetical protein CAEBREN_10019 [Caenorhabditis brenneri]|uniref:Serpentine Receptor, class H n=1 Tax=Caenorhabditis brenneri TaxID=135651 RepID=G0MU52_CAEBE|nr:hypothetical protein CAEBREN_10019 [Caenorhabditis brenneri]
MNITCISTHRYLDTPEFLTIALHINTIMSTPVYIFGIFIILTKTPEQMKTVKWCLVNVHGWIILFDYSVSIMTMPFLLLPAFGGYPLGILKYFGVPTFVQTMSVMIIFGWMWASTVLVFENRFYIICTVQVKNRWKKMRRKWMFCHYSYVFVLAIPCYWFVPDQEQAVQKIFESLPCLPGYIYEAPVFVLTENCVYHLSVIVIFIAICSIEVLIMVFYMSYTIVHQLKGKTVSRKTFEMQKNFLVALLMQVLIPLTMIVIPVIPWLFLIITYTYIQSIVNFTIIIATSHGSVATIVMLIVHRPYREAILLMIRKKPIGSVNNSRRIMYAARNALSDINN